jgi:hypothetical protein
VPEEESALAAEAVGPTSPQSRRSREVDSLLPLSQWIVSGKGSHDGDGENVEGLPRANVANPESSNPDVSAVVLKSPQLADLDSPAPSDDGGGDGNDDGEGASEDER